MATQDTTYTSLKGFSEIGNTLFTTNYELNIKEFFEWGLLGKGGFFNITSTASGYYGGNQGTLKYVGDSRTTSGTVFQTFRAPIVWQSSIEYTTQPIIISGITVDGLFLPKSTTGASGYHIDYNLGQVVFATGINSNAVITMEFSHYWANMHVSRKAPWLQQAFEWADRIDHAHYDQRESGHFNIFRENRIELPAVVFEIIPGYRADPKCLGGGRIQKQDFFAHIWATNSWERNQLKDILLLQLGKTMFLFDVNQMENSGLLPLKNNGDIRHGATVYPVWTAPTTESGSFRYRCARLEDFSAVEIIRPQEGLWTSTVRGRLEVEVPLL